MDFIKIKLYDYADEEKEYLLDATIDDIDYIKIVVLTGDETAFISFKKPMIDKDGGDVKLGILLDSSDCRSVDFIDGGYILKSKEAIERWMRMNFVPSDELIDDDRANSYKRLYKFAPNEESKYGIYERYNKLANYSFPEIA